MDYLTTVRVLDTDYKLKDEEAARIHHTHKVAEIEDMPDSKALLPTGGGAGQVLAKKSGTDYDVEWQDSSSTVPDVIPVDKGGTGATDAASARSNLGAAASSHTHTAGDITSGTLSVDRLPTVPVSKGGTGATDAATARANLGLYQNPTTIGDCNAAPAGFSWYTTGTSNRPTDFGHLVTFDGANWKFQIALGTYGGMWWRQNINAGGWTKWSQLANNPTSSSYYLLVPIYRVYNKYDKTYLFTADNGEYNNLVSAGWNGEGVAFYAFR